MKLKSLTSRGAERLGLELFKHFRVVKKLGVGCYSTVYEVLRLSDQGRYALKHIPIEAVDPREYGDIVNEIRVLASLEHPCLCRYCEAWVEAGQLFIVTDLATGGDLGTLLEKAERRREHLQERLIWSYFLQMAVAVQHLHHNRVLHRDLKPHNVLLCEDGMLKIGDLGISSILDHVFTDRVMGTPHYLSPEMWRRQPYSFSADVWALGCMLHEMCTLRPLFLPSGRPSDDDIRRRVLGGISEPIPSRYSLEMWDVIKAMLQPDPARRPTVREVLQMPEVKAHLYLLPREVQPHLDPSYNGRVKVPGLFRISVSAEKWGQLNAVLPPAKYTAAGSGSSGGGVAAALAARQQQQHPGGGLRRPSSCPDLAELEAAAACAACAAGGGAAAGAQQPGLGAPPSLFRFSGAYPQLSGWAKAEALRRASMDAAQQAQRAQQAREGGTSSGAAEGGAAGEQGPDSSRSSSSGPPPPDWPLRRCKSEGDAFRAKRRPRAAAAAPVGSFMQAHDPPPVQLGSPPRPGAAWGPGSAGWLATGGSSGPSGGSGSDAVLRFPVNAGYLAGYQQGSGAAPVGYTVYTARAFPAAPLSTIEQEPSEYNSSYHGGSRYDGSYHGSYSGGPGSHAGGGPGSYGGSYHGGTAAFDGSYHGDRPPSIFDGSYHGGRGGSNHDSSYHGNRSGSGFDGSYHGRPPSVFDSSYHGGGSVSSPKGGNSSFRGGHGGGGELHKGGGRASGGGSGSGGGSWGGGAPGQQAQQQRKKKGSFASRLKRILFGADGRNGR